MDKVLQINTDQVTHAGQQIQTLARQGLDASKAFGDLLARQDNLIPINDFSSNFQALATEFTRGYAVIMRQRSEIGDLLQKTAASVQQTDATTAQEIVDLQACLTNPPTLTLGLARRDASSGTDTYTDPLFSELQNHQGPLDPAALGVEPPSALFVSDVPDSFPFTYGDS